MTKPLRIMQYNLENFFIYLDKELPSGFPQISEEHWQSLTNSTVKLKPLKKILAIQRLINEHSPEVLALCEVGGLESLQQFNTHFLNEDYDCHLIEGNSDRGIDVGYLVKKDLPFKVLLNSYKQRPIHFLYEHEKGGNKKSHYFSRDVAELRLFTHQNSPPKLIILNVHLKSKLDPDHIDPDGRGRRTAELNTLVEIYNEIFEEFNGTVPILVTGDFNGVANSRRKDVEYTRLYQSTQLRDIMELAQTDESQRFTQVLFNSLNQPAPIQIDYMFIDAKFADLLAQPFVVRYVDEGGLEIPPPINVEQRAQLPSDHYPIICDLKL